MPKTINLNTYKDDRGTLTVIDNALPFEVKRIYYVYGASGIRGGHRHHESTQALICVKGQCEIHIQTPEKDEAVLLDDPAKCLILDPRDWHTMEKFSKDALLLCLSSTHYDVHDYIDEPYRPVDKPLVRGRKTT